MLVLLQRSLEGWHERESDGASACSSVSLRPDDHISYEASADILESPLCRRKRLVRGEEMTARSLVPTPSRERFEPSASLCPCPSVGFLLKTFGQSLRPYLPTPRRNDLITDAYASLNPRMFA
jgi:hypothetical protein